jgi:hypothetical protein
MAAPRMSHGSRRVLGWLLPLAGALLALGVVIRQCTPPSRDPADPPEGATVTHSLVLERVQAVAKLVASETVVRDVVVYEHTRFGSTKRSLVVAAGKILAGFDLDTGATVRIDEAARRITITLPRASVLAVEITDLKTYDERSGLLNPFRPADRDAIYRLARAQLLRAARESGITEHANRSARQLLEAMFSRDGYTAEVHIAQVSVEEPRRQ